MAQVAIWQKLHLHQIYDLCKHFLHLLHQIQDVLRPKIQTFQFMTKIWQKPDTIELEMCLMYMSMHSKSLKCTFIKAVTPLLLLLNAFFLT